MAPPRKYPQVVKTLIDEIRYGTYPVGGEFPNLDMISRTYGISRVTAFRVLTVLVEEGYISTGRGRKSMVIAREKISLCRNGFGFKNIALVADFNLSGSSEITLKMVYSIQHELKEGGHHVSCLQYQKNMDLRTDDVDAYILFDILDVFGEYHELVRSSGKPYVVIGNMKQQIQPNRIHVNFKSALWKLINHFLMSKIENYVFLLLDEKSVYRNSRAEQLQKISNYLQEEILHPLLGALESHAIDSAKITFHYGGARTETSRKQLSEIFRNLAPGAAIIAISEAHATESCNHLKQQGLHPLRDFQLAVIDIAPDIKKEDLRNLFLVKLDLPDLLGKILHSLEYQHLQRNNFAPGNITHSTLDRT